MNEAIKERISALVDGELSEFETRRVLEEINSNPQSSLEHKNFLPTNSFPERLPDKNNKNNIKNFFFIYLLILKI